MRFEAAAEPWQLELRVVSAEKPSIAKRDQPASDGSGPLFQRDYWAVIRGCSISPVQLVQFVREKFCELAPKELVRFTRESDADPMLQKDEVMGVRIRMGPDVSVRVAHLDENSLTLSTERGHPEAGRITFGSYRNDRGDVIFHIRSRARSRSRLHYAGFLVTGDPMQTSTWVDFIDRLAHTIGDGVIGNINAEKSTVEDDEEDAGCDNPTFIAKGD